MTKIWIKTIVVVVWLSFGSPFSGAESSTELARADGTAKPNEMTLNLGNNVVLKLVAIPAGKFLMGSPKDEDGRGDDEGLSRGQWVKGDPRVEVEISRPFYMAAYEVTVEQYAQFWKDSGREERGFKFPEQGVDATSNHPAVDVSWNDAEAFCQWLSKKTGKKVALPTEAQWEYACLAGATGPYGGTGRLDEMGWYVDNSELKAHPVGQKKPNAWGLYDMHGNVWEWCADWYADGYTGSAKDPRGPAQGESRVLRGGGWISTPSACRSAERWSETEFTDYVHRSRCGGFRIVLDPKEMVLDLGNNVFLKLAEIPAGSFLMGSPKEEPGHQDTEGLLPAEDGGNVDGDPRVEVEISRNFYMGVYEVTLEQYAQFQRDSGRKDKVVQYTQSRRNTGRKNRGVNRDEATGIHPVEYVQWDDAQAFCEWLSKKTGYKVKLPTEAQWEYACRAGTTGPYAGTGKLDEMGWYVDNSGGKTHPVGQKMPNAWGLYDMHGNVWELCADWFALYTGPAKDPTGPSEGQSRVRRGGSYDRPPNGCRSAVRGPSIMCGFRVVLEMD
jgi:formylglycine-generating enzyme required for sulfatase activity